MSDITPASLVRENRRDMGITLKEYGEMWGVSRQAVSKWEKGLSQPPNEVLMDIMRDAVYDDRKGTDA